MRHTLIALDDPAFQAFLHDVARFCLFRHDIARLLDDLEAAR
jgi:hypothetical protein